MVPGWPHIQKTLRCSAHNRKWAGSAAAGDLASSPDVRDRALCLSAMAREGMDAAPGFLGVAFDQMVLVLVVESQRLETRGSNGGGGGGSGGGGGGGVGDGLSAADASAATVTYGEMSAEEILGECVASLTQLSALPLVDGTPTDHAR